MPAKQYPKAPITEAVIDFRVRNPAQPKDVEALAERIGRRYGTKEALQHFNISFDQPAQTVGMRASVDGFRYRSLDQANVCLINSGGMTTSRIAPYLGWESLRADAEKNWSDWRKATGSSLISRIGVRYINRIDIPESDSGVFDPEDYLNIAVKIPSVSPHPLLGFGIQVIGQAAKPSWRFLVQTGRVIPSPLVGHISLLLDIDVSRETDIPAAPKRLWSVVDEAREVKNYLFESLINDTTRKIFS